MPGRLMGIFAVALLIIVVVVAIVLALLFRTGTHSAGPATPTVGATPAGPGITVHNDTSVAVQVQDCTGSLSTCATSNMGTTTLSAGASGTEHNATGLRILNTSGSVRGCISLNGVSAPATVQISSAKSCP